FVDANDVGLRGRRLEDDLFEVEDDVAHVLDHVGDGGELVERALDLDGRDGGALKRREEHAAKRVADRDSEPALEGLAYELAVELARAFRVEADALRTDEVAPVARDHGACGRHAVLLVLRVRESGPTSLPALGK